MQEAQPLLAEAPAPDALLAERVRIRAPTDLRAYRPLEALQLPAAVVQSA